MTSNLTRGGAAVVAVLCLGSAAVGEEKRAIATCGDLTLAQPGLGVRYTGVVANNAYEVVAKIPAGVTGWGAGEGAPFHGFAMFIAGTGACIVFEIHIRVDDEPARVPADYREVAVGNIRGWQGEAAGLVEATAWTNVTTTFAFQHRGDHFDDGSVTMAVPTNMRKKAEPLLQEFLAGLRFGVDAPEHPRRRTRR